MKSLLHEVWTLGKALQMTTTKPFVTHTKTWTECESENAKLFIKLSVESSREMK